VATVTLLAARRINPGRLQKRLQQAGYLVSAEPCGFRLGDGRPVIVDTTLCDQHGPADALTELATELFGGPPRGRVSCTFDGPPAVSPEWTTVVDVARAVAAIVPLAALHDGTGTVYLVHPQRGLIGPDEYRAIPKPEPALDVLRRLLGGR
jgi:hypothetical protein